MWQRRGPLKDCGLFDTKLNFTVKQEEAFFKREKYLREKYKDYIAAEDTSPIKGNRTFDEKIAADDLRKVTMKEIFKVSSPSKKPLNYVNYSHHDYNLINGEDLPKRSSPLPDPIREDMGKL